MSILIINDLNIISPYLWKLLDDTAKSEIVPKGSVSNALCIADRDICWFHENRVQLNSDKSKELRISFAKKSEAFDPVVVDGKEVEVVNSIKLLGLTITNDLSWNAHVGRRTLL